MIAQPPPRAIQPVLAVLLIAADLPQKQACVPRNPFSLPEQRTYPLSSPSRTTQPITQAFLPKSTPVRAQRFFESWFCPWIQENLQKGTCNARPRRMCRILRRSKPVGVGRLERRSRHPSVSHSTTVWPEHSAHSREIESITVKQACNIPRLVPFPRSRASQSTPAPTTAWP